MNATTEKFTSALNFAMLHDAGMKRQAHRQAENESIWSSNDWAKEVTVFGFDDGSAVFTSGPEFRVATEAEVAEYK